MNDSSEGLLIVDFRPNRLSFSFAHRRRFHPPLALGGGLRIRPSEGVLSNGAISCSMAGNPADNLGAALTASTGFIDWNSTGVIFGAPNDPFSFGISSLASALKCFEFLVAQRPRRRVVQTRSPLILLAVPLLKSSPNSEVRFAIETADDSLHCRLLSSFPRPSERIKALERLLSINISTRLQIAPLVLRNESVTHLRGLVSVVQNFSIPKNIYQIESLCSPRVEAAIAQLYQARKNLLPEAHRIFRNMLIRAGSDEGLLGRTA